MTRYLVTHRTDYRYGAAISAGQTVAHLMPRETPTQRVLSRELVVNPEPDDLDDHVDVYGNTTTYLAISRPHEALSVTARSEVELRPPSSDRTAADGGDDSVECAPAPAWEAVGEIIGAGSTEEHLLARRFRLDSPFVAAGEELAAYARPSFGEGAPVDDAATDLMHRIKREFTFDPDFSDVSTPLAEVMAHRRGVCQDFAHLMIGCLRSLGLGARYVSGYIETDPPPGRPKLVGADASHAWVSLFVPGRGWLDFDPTNDQVDPQRHITVAWGRDYSDVAPMRGVVFGPRSSQVLSVSVDVRRSAAP